MRSLRAVSVFLIALALHGEPAAAADLKWLRDPDRGIAIAYDAARWRRAEPAERATVFVINWLDKKEQRLVATCYIQAVATKLPQEVAANIRANRDAIAAAIMKNARKRDSGARLVSAEPSYADNLEAIYIVRRLQLRSFDLEAEMTFETLFTVWQGEEIILECGYPDVLREEPIAHAFVEKEIRKILRRLHIER